MAYVAPHKRSSKAKEGSPPTPAELIPKFKNSLNLNSSKSGRRKDWITSRRMNIVYANHSISRWLTVPSLDDAQLTSLLSLVPLCLESAEFKEQKQYTLVYNREQQEHNENDGCDLEDTWASVAETVHAGLISAFQNIRNELVAQSVEETKPSLVARFGKVLFRRNPSHNQNSIKENSVSKSYLNNSKRMFYTNVPEEYMEHIKNVIVPGLGVRFEEEKERYRVKLVDVSRPESIISCRCRVQKDVKKLELYKIELNPVRQLIVDMSVLNSSVDLRVALCTKKILTALREEEMQNIRDLISSAELDPNVKGGLRWPLGKAKSGGQYTVVSAWQTKAASYSSSSIRLKFQKADRFEFSTSTGEVSREIALKLTEINRSLLEQRSEDSGVLAMLEEALKLIRNNFLAWEGSLVSCSAS